MLAQQLTSLATLRSGSFSAVLEEKCLVLLAASYLSYQKEKKNGLLGYQKEWQNLRKRGHQLERLWSPAVA